MLGDMFTSKWRTVTKHNYSEREGRWQQYIKNSQPIPNNKDVTCFIWQSYISSVQSMPTIKGSSLCMLFYMSCQIFLLWLNSVRSLPRPAHIWSHKCLKMLESVGKQREKGLSVSGSTVERWIDSGWFGLRPFIWVHPTALIYLLWCVQLGTLIVVQGLELRFLWF